MATRTRGGRGPASRARASIVRPSAAAADARGASGPEQQHGGDRERSAATPTARSGGSGERHADSVRSRRDGRSKDVLPVAKVAPDVASSTPTVSDRRPSRPYDGRYRTMPRVPRAAGLDVAAPARNPCPRSARSAPSATTPPRSATSGRRRRPAVRRHRRPTTSAPLLARHPANVVRLDLPADEPGDEPDDRYRRAARTLAAWRSDGTLRKDPRPSIYVYEQAYRVPGTDVERTQRGFFARLRLEPFGPEVRRPAARADAGGPARRTATGCCARPGVNTSPVVGLYDDPTGAARRRLADAAAGRARRRGDRRRRRPPPPVGRPRRRRGAVGDAPPRCWRGRVRRPVTIADGHHRYETALRYRDERRMTRSCEEDPAFDYLLTLFLDAPAEPLTVLPTHRVVRGLGDDGVGALLERLRASCSTSTPVGDRTSCVARVRGGRRAARRRGPVRPVDARRRRAARRRGATRSSRALPARRRRRAARST